MHEQLHTSDPDVEELVEMYHLLPPEHQKLFMAHLSDLLKSAHNPSCSASPQETDN